LFPEAGDLPGASCARGLAEVNQARLDPRDAAFSIGIEGEYRSLVGRRGSDAREHAVVRLRSRIKAET